MTGWRREEAIGNHSPKSFQIIDGATRKPARDPMEKAVEQNKTVGLTLNCVPCPTADGFESAIERFRGPHPRTAQAALSGLVIVFHNVSAARAMTLQMTYFAQQ